MGIKGNRRGERDVGCAGVTAGCLRKGVVEAVYRPAIAPGKQVTIDGQGNARGVMAQPVLNVRERLAGFDQQRPKLRVCRIHLAEACAPREDRQDRGQGDLSHTCTLLHIRSLPSSSRSLARWMRWPVVVVTLIRLPRRHRRETTSSA